jgi:hypothetical protein
MNYQEYIELGFKRHDLDCAVEMKQTGYGGFSLEKKLKSFSIGVTSPELDKPKLYIPKTNSETYHIIPISTECVIDLCSNDKLKHK